MARLPKDPPVAEERKIHFCNVYSKYINQYPIKDTLMLCNGDEKYLRVASVEQIMFERSSDVACD